MRTTGVTGDFLSRFLRSLQLRGFGRPAKLVLALLPTSAKRPFGRTSALLHAKSIGQRHVTAISALLGSGFSTYSELFTPSGHFSRRTRLANKLRLRTDLISVPKMLRERNLSGGIGCTFAVSRFVHHLVCTRLIISWPRPRPNAAHFVESLKFRSASGRDPQRQEGG
jgi:hypothetical protein